MSQHPRRGRGFGGTYQHRSRVGHPLPSITNATSDIGQVTSSRRSAPAVVRDARHYLTCMSLLTDFTSPPPVATVASADALIQAIDAAILPKNWRLPALTVGGPAPAEPFVRA
jgi:hypothetical protein